MVHPWYKTILIAIIVLILAVSAFAWFSNYKQGAPREIPTEAVAQSVIVEDTVATEGVLRIPDGFPEELRVEEEPLLEAFKVRDMNAGTVRYVLKYASSDTPEVAWAEYHSLMTSAGYSIETPGLAGDSIALFGINGSGSLSVNITTEDNRTIVRLNYYQK